MSVVLVAVMVAGFSACSRDGASVSPTVNTDWKSEPKRPAARTISLPVVEGIVQEYTNAERYTYFRLKMTNEERWVAMPETDLAVGEKISVFAGSVMSNHHNKALDRTFDTMHFSTGLSSGKKRSDSVPCALVFGSDRSGKLTGSNSPGSFSRRSEGGGVLGGVFTGSVVEVRDVPGYTYVQIVSGTNSIWAAAPRFKVARGDKVTVSMQMAMRDYTSSSLKKSFAVLYMAEEIPVIENAGTAK